MRIKLTWEEFLKIAKDAILEKYPSIDIKTLEFYKDYGYDGEGRHYDFPTGIYIDESTIKREER